MSDLSQQLISRVSGLQSAMDTLRSRDRAGMAVAGQSLANGATATPLGSVAGLSSVVTAMALSSWGLIPGVLAGLAVGLAVGAVNGALVSLLGIPSFLVTLGMLGIANGTAPDAVSNPARPIAHGAGGSARRPWRASSGRCRWPPRCPVRENEPPPN